MVTSLSTPSPATMMPQSTTEVSWRLGAAADRTKSSSDATPVKWAQRDAAIPSRAIMISPNSVPTRAVLVRALKPWAA